MKISRDGQEMTQEAGDELCYLIDTQGRACSRSNPIPLEQINELNKQAAASAAAKGTYSYSSDKHPYHNRSSGDSKRRRSGRGSSGGGGGGGADREHHYHRSNSDRRFEDDRGYNDGARRDRRGYHDEYSSSRDK